MATGSGYLSQHEAPKPADEESINPPEEELELAKQIDKLFEKYANYRRKYDRTWVDNYKFFKGDQWLQKRPSYKSREVVNMIFRTIMGQTSVMMDTRPTVGFLPQEPSDLELSEILNQVFEADWTKHEWMMDLFAIMLDGELYSVGYGETCYEEDQGNGKGGISWYCRDPFSCYPDPDAMDVNKRAEGFIYAEPVDVDKLKMKYANHPYVSKIKADLDDVTRYKRGAETLHIKRNTDLDIDPDRPRASVNEQEMKDKALVITAYLKPSDTEEVESADESGGVLYITRRKYPKGRKVVKICNYIFEDTELPYDDMDFPFERYVVNPLPREFYGLSTVDTLRGPQVLYNRILNFIVDVLHLTGNPVWLVPLGSGVNTRKLTNEPGLAIEHNDNIPPRREEGVQLQPYVLQLFDRVKTLFDDQAGENEVTRGINPTGVTANSAIENLLDAAQKRVKQKIRNVDVMLTQFGRHWLSRCFQFYTVPQIYRLTNKEGAQKYFKFHVEHYDDGQGGTKKRAIMREDTKNDLGQAVPALEDKKYEIEGEFDVRVDTISGLPFTKSENEQRVLNLFDRGIIDASEVLSRLEYPNKDQILQRMQEAQAQAAAAAPKA
jgi:hypothetical protein